MWSNIEIYGFSFFDLADCSSLCVNLASRALHVWACIHLGSRNVQVKALCSLFFYCSGIFWLKCDPKVYSILFILFGFWHEWLSFVEYRALSDLTSSILYLLLNRTVYIP